VSAISDLIDSRIREVMTAIPGRVTAYNSELQAADVQPLVQRAYLDESGIRQVEDLPVIPRVPVQFQGSGSVRMTFPIAKGDTVLLVFAQSSLDKWESSGLKVDPLDDRHHDLSDAIAIPGLLSFADATDQVHSTDLVLAAPGIRLGSKDAADPVLRQSDLTPLVAWIAAHIHPASAGTTSAATPPPSAVTGSPKVRID
jgi:hypothetical protein